MQTEVRPHLVIDCRMINASGIGTYIKNVLPLIIQDRTFVISCLGYSDLTHFSWFKEVKFIEISAGIFSLKEQFELYKKIPISDIYWSPNWNACLFKVKAKHRIVTVHDVYHLAFAKELLFHKVIYIKLFLKRIIALSKCIITVSLFSKKEIVKYLGCEADKITVIPLAVTKNFDKGFYYKKITHKYILFVGNVKPHKNLENALKAYRLLKADNIFFYIIGKREGFIAGEYNLEILIEGIEDKVIFTGFVSNEELKNYYANALMFIFPSKYEGFGLPILEAMKFDIPILSSNAASLPEVGGDAVTYFDPEDIDDIFSKLSALLNENYRVDNIKYKKQLDKFSWTDTAKRHIELFKSLS